MAWWWAKVQNQCLCTQKCATLFIQAPWWAHEVLNNGQSLKKQLLHGQFTEKGLATHNEEFSLQVHLIIIQSLIMNIKPLTILFWKNFILSLDFYSGSYNPTNFA